MTSLRDNPERGFFASASGGGSLTTGRVVLVVRVVPCIHDGFRIDLDDGPVGRVRPGRRGRPRR